MKSQLQNWSQDDFLTYLLIYAANADFEITEEERQFILNKVGQQEFHQMLKIFNQHSDYERGETVQFLGQLYCGDPANKCDIRTEMVKLFFADEEYNLLEKNFFIAIKKLLNLDS